MKIILSRSRLILAYLLLSHLAALVLLCLYGTGGLRLIVTALVIVSLVYYCRVSGWWPKQLPLVTALREEEEGWFMVRRDGREQGPMRLVRSVMLGPFLMVYFQTVQKQSKRSLLIAQDALDRDSWRRLRVRLRDPEAWA